MEVNTAGKMLGKDDFLKLFTYQLRYQNPLKPLEGTEFSAQLAQFSSLEQLFNMNENLQEILNYQSSLNNAMALGLIGRQVKATDGTSGRVTGVSFLDGVTNLVIDNDKKIPLSGIQEIY